MGFWAEPSMNAQIIIDIERVIVTTRVLVKKVKLPTIKLSDIIQPRL